jgi:hypothetical protein
MAVVIWLDVDPQQFDRLDLQTRLLTELAAKPLDGTFRLVDEAAWEIPVTLARVVRAARQQHAPVALEDALHARDGVAPVPAVALLAREVVLLLSEVSATAGTEAPVVEDTHEEDMMENPEPTEDEQELAATERQQEEEDMRGTTDADEDNLPTEDVD